jgi:hypothetical protein
MALYAFMEKDSIISPVVLLSLGCVAFFFDMLDIMIDIYILIVRPVEVDNTRERKINAGLLQIYGVF